ncbi:MAG: long-chain fatty acid--CoA ligase [Deltaproteobacteria bacterium HGW-Deltaproteobacteria-15]|jgi:long-chain acyl-CoA synthetase|nr:MAG: long-chain fatty acid--CoA ligase [Deltaproteobacteria bacterium HGW-Deltaproteobacteria-15]
MRTIRHFVDLRASETPEKIYMIAPEPGLTVTYSQLREESIRLGKHLLKRGLRKGDKVSFMMGNGYQTTKLFLGIMYGGFVVAPLNLQAQQSQVEYVLDHSDTKLVFFTEDQRERLEKGAGKVGRRIELIKVDNDAVDLFPGDKDLSGLTLPEVTEEDEALLLYTSGTTGQPKGVILSHKNMVAGGQYTAMAHELSPEDRALCSLPLYHINGEVVTAVSPLISGGSVVMPHKFSTSNFWELISEHGCTWFSVVPTIISYLINSTDLKEKNVRVQQVRFGRSASSALPPELHKAFEEKFGISIVETMGLTETAAPVLSNPIDPAKRKYGSPGQAVGNKAKIVDTQGREVARGTQGEIMIQGENVMKGYYKAPDITAKTLREDGWLHTGDLGYMDEDGFVFVTGRLKELIIKGGENIAPREIDEALYRHPAVLEAAAVGIPDKDYGEEILACVALKPGYVIEEQDLRTHCLDHLGKFKTPKIIRFLDELPKGPSGKIQRLKLRDLVQ